LTFFFFSIISRGVNITLCYTSTGAPLRWLAEGYSHVRWISFRSRLRRRSCTVLFPKHIWLHASRWRVAVEEMLQTDIRAKCYS
jgi:hypothetical protein